MWTGEKEHRFMLECSGICSHRHLQLIGEFTAPASPHPSIPSNYLSNTLTLTPPSHIKQTGHEATISYLGGPQLLPLEGRRQALGNFGFSCRCVRGWRDVM